MERRNEIRWQHVLSDAVVPPEWPHEMPARPTQFAERFVACLPRFDPGRLIVSN
jgi:hypothetical protein